MKSIRTVLLFIFSILLHPVVSQAQVDNTTETVDRTSVTIDSTSSDRVTFFDLFEGKPGRAALYSFLLPGGGQAYNRKYWKVPLAVAIDAGTISYIIYTRKQYKTADEAYRKQIGNVSLRDTRDSRRKNYEYSWVYFVIGRVVGVLDAYVDRHMMDFDISEDLSLRLSPNTKVVGATLALNFHGERYRKTPPIAVY